jgi:hypothetical protein
MDTFSVPATRRANGIFVCGYFQGRGVRDWPWFGLIGGPIRVDSLYTSLISRAFFAKSRLPMFSHRASGAAEAFIREASVGCWGRPGHPRVELFAKSAQLAFYDRKPLLFCAKFTRIATFTAPFVAIWPPQAGQEKRAQIIYEKQKLCYILSVAESNLRPFLGGRIAAGEGKKLGLEPFGPQPGSRGSAAEKFLFESAVTH